VTRLLGAQLGGLRGCGACGAALRRHAAKLSVARARDAAGARQAGPSQRRWPRACARDTPAAAPLAEGAQGADARREGARLVWLC
jgi:hypothetical protein